MVCQWILWRETIRGRLGRTGSMRGSVQAGWDGSTWVTPQVAGRWR